MGDKARISLSPKPSLRGVYDNGPKWPAEVIKGPPSPVYIRDRKNLVLDKSETDFVFNSLDHNK